MNDKERAAMQQALEALVVAEEFVDRHSEDWYISGQQDLKQIREAITALREALAGQAEQDPVAIVGFDTQGWRNLVDALIKLPDGTKLWAEPSNKTEEKPLLVQAWEKRFAEQAEQEPVVNSGCLLCANGNDVPEGEWCRACGFSNESNLSRAVRMARGSDMPPTKSLKFAAPVRTKDLTEDEVQKLWNDTSSIVPMWAHHLYFARAVIAADREKNRG